MKIETDWDKVARPKKPRAGKLADDEGVVTVKWGRRGKQKKDAGYAVRFCSGTKANCDSGPKSKANVATPQDSGVTTSQFARFAKDYRGKKKGDLMATAMEDLCKGAKPGVCRAQVGYRDGRRVMRFCTGKGKPGHIVDIHGKSPAEVRDLTLKACQSFVRRGAYPKRVGKVKVGEAALGGTRKRRSVRKRRTR